MSINQNQHFSGATNFYIDSPIKGQQQLAMIDPLRQIALRPELREGQPGVASIIMPYADSGFEGLFSQLQQMVGGPGYRTVMAKEFYWAQYEQLETLAFGVNKSVQSVPAAGASVTVKISRLGQSANGMFVKPGAGFHVIIKENNRQIAKIASVVPVAAGDFNITLSPINGEVLDLTRKAQYTLVLMPLRQYDINSTDDIKGHGMVYNPPVLWKSFVQKWEDRIDINEDEIDNYIYDMKWSIVKGFDSRGDMVDYFYSPQMMKKLRDAIMANRNLNTLFGQRDNVAKTGFDGVIPSVEKYGMFNTSYDSLLNGSFTSILMNQIKSIRKINGSNEYMMIHDFNFGMDWSLAMGKMIKDYGQNLNYSLFGAGGEGARDFRFFEFGDFGYNKYKFRSMQMDSMDSFRFGRLLENFCLMLPAKRFTDTEGRSVPWLTFCNLVGAEPAKAWETWLWDFRKSGGRNLSIFAKDAFGIELHALTTAGLIKKSSAS